MAWGVVTLGQQGFFFVLYYHGNVIGSACVANLKGQWFQCLRKDNDGMSG